MRHLTQHSERPRFINSRKVKWQVVYFHTGVSGWFNYGPLKTLKTSMENNECANGERLLCAFHAIHMGYTAKSFNGSVFSCSKKGDRKLPLHYHDTIVHLLR